MPEPYIPPHEDMPDHQGLKPRVKAMSGQPPMVAFDSRRGRLLTPGDDTPTLIALVFCLATLIGFMLYGRMIS